MRWIGRVAGLVMLVVSGFVAIAPAQAADPPKRVLIIVLDQFRPDYVNTFQMSNVKQLMHDGASFDNAYLGHMASETVITHNVITSGQLPKDMGWGDEAYRDTEGVLSDARGMWISGSLGRDDFNKLIDHADYWKLADYLKATYPGTKFITAGQKSYAVYSANGPTGDVSMTMGSRNADCDEDPDTTANYRRPTGFGVPAAITAECSRYFVDTGSTTYGTSTTPPAWLYPLDGNRFAPGHDPDHLGGDIWTADAGMALMAAEPDWSGMLLTLGSIDKASHMWGGITDTGKYPAGSDAEQAHLRFIAKTADDQVGRIMDHLEDERLLDETLVVLTTDHAGQPSTNFNGELGTAAAPRDGNLNWYYGTTLNGTFDDPSSSLAPLIGTGNVRFSYQDSAIRTWLNTTTPEAKTSAALVMATLPDVIATYALDGDHYRLVTANTAAMTGRERLWWQKHAQEIVDTMAAPYSADVVGLLRDNSSYGVAGDHGGAQQPVQEIPIVFAGSGVGKKDSKAPMRSVDILPTILQQMQIAPRAGLDGTAQAVPAG